MNEQQASDRILFLELTVKQLMRELLRRDVLDAESVENISGALATHSEGSAGMEFLADRLADDFDNTRRSIGEVAKRAIDNGARAKQVWPD